MDETLTATLLFSNKILSFENKWMGRGEPQLLNLKASFSFLAKVSKSRKGKNQHLPYKAGPGEAAVPQGTVPPEGSAPSERSYYEPKARKGEKSEAYLGVCHLEA